MSVAPKQITALAAATTFLFIFLISTPLSGGFKCHQCNSARDENCTSIDKESEIYKKECEGPKNYTVCRKIITTIHETIVTKQGDKKINTDLLKPRVKRQCGYERDEYYDNSCRTHGSSRTSSQVICSCTDEEACNGSPRNTAFQIGFYLFCAFAYSILY